MLRPSVVDGINGHVAFVEERLLMEHLHQTACVFRQSFFSDGLYQLIIVDGVAIELAGELDEVEQEGLTLWDISQMFGIQLKKLRLYNIFRADAPIRPGDTIILRKL